MKYMKETRTEKTIRRGTVDKYCLQDTIQGRMLVY